MSGRTRYANKTDRPNPQSPIPNPQSPIPMNYQKLDAALAMALNQVENPQERSFVIFIHTQPVLESAAQNFLMDLGVSKIAEQKTVFNATVSAHAIAELSEQSWVKYLKLSLILRFVSRG